MTKHVRNYYAQRADDLLQERNRVIELGECLAEATRELLPWIEGVAESKEGAAAFALRDWDELMNAEYRTDERLKAEERLAFDDLAAATKNLPRVGRGIEAENERLRECVCRLIAAGEPMRHKLIGYDCGSVWDTTISEVRKVVGGPDAQ